MTCTFLETLCAVYAELERSWLCSLWLSAPEALHLFRLDSLASRSHSRSHLEQRCTRTCRSQLPKTCVCELEPEPEHEHEHESDPASEPRDAGVPLGALCGGEPGLLPRASARVRRLLAECAVLECVRARGWVAHPGLKFGADLLLYRAGPEYFHSEYALHILHDEREWNAPYTSHERIRQLRELGVRVALCKRSPHHHHPLCPLYSRARGDLVQHEVEVHAAHVSECVQATCCAMGSGHPWSNCSSLDADDELEQASFWTTGAR